MERNLKIVYVANLRLPTEKAHGIQVMKMCEAFALAGLQVELIVPRRINKIKKDPFEYYGVKKVFKIKKLPVIDLVFLDFPLAFLIETLTFTASLIFSLVFRRGNYVIYTRGEMVLALALISKILKKPLFWETHIKPENFGPYRRIFQRVNGFVTVNEYYKKELSEKFGVPDDKILCAPDGVDLQEFNVGIGKDEARKKLNLPPDKKIIFYGGSFLAWKGTDVFIGLSKILQPDAILVLAACGEREDIERFKSLCHEARAKNILLLEQRPHQEIPYYLKAADVLVLTGTPKSEISLRYTSPLKLFEYMASGRPILAADIPSFREILNEDNAVFFEPDNAGDLSESVKNLLQNPDFANRISERAFADVKNYTWFKRSGNIMNFIKNA